VSVLVTGFEPFGENAVNPSQLLAEELGGVVLPVSYARAAAELRAAVDERKPSLVLCFGLAEKRTAITVERFAHNRDEACTVDNDDAGGSGAEIEPKGPVAYRTRLPVEAIVAALEAEEIPVEISRDAGGYLCNHVFYVLMHTLGRDQLGGFVHVPPLEVLPPERLTHAARVIVEVCEPRASTS
jgi:pyroglutamyl-peptidase